MGNITRSSSFLVSIFGLLIIGSAVFKAGFAVGIIVVIIILVIIFAIARMFRK
jgi:hypothetical protein